MLRKNHQLIVQLQSAKSIFADDLADMSLVEAYQKLMATDTVRGKLYTLIKPYISHLLFGAQLVNKLCESIHTLTLQFMYMSRHSKKSECIKNIRKRQRLCGDATKIKNINQVYYYDFTKRKHPRKATEHDVENALASAIRTVQRHGVL